MTATHGEGDKDLSISNDAITGPGTASTLDSLTLTITDDAAGKLPHSFIHSTMPCLALLGSGPDGITQWGTYVCIAFISMWAIFDLDVIHVHVA